MVDRISRLQDEILCYILSFVTTKEAVATSVLSKRWTHLWISVPNIDFTNIRVDSIISNYKFNESVYSVLASRDAAGSNVDSFHLDIEYSDPHLAYDCGFPNIVRWINHVVQRKLKHLRLHLNEGKYDDDNDDDDDDDDEDVSLPKLPISIFTCKTLVSLDLYRFCVEGFDFSSIGFGFPSLKTLNLEYIEFFEDRDFVLLLSGCPNLEDLKLFDVFFAYDKDPLVLQEFKSLSLPKLTRANISKCFWYFFRLEALSTSQSTCLDTLKLYTKDHEVGEVNQLQRLYSDIHIFHNLTYLRMPLTDSLDLMVQVLHHCPKLQDLELYREPMCTKDGKNLVEPKFVPQCLSSYLRTCTILNMGGLQSELTFATYILKNARILQTLEIWTQRKQEQPEIERKLSPCPKASATCQLLVY